MIVSDEPSVLRFTGHVLGASGYEVLTAASGEEALEIHSPQPADLVISDAVLPDMRGPALLDAVSQSSPSTALIVMSGYPLDELPRGVSFILKPFRRVDLIAVAALALARVAQSGEVVARESQRAQESHPQSEGMLPDA